MNFLPNIPTKSDDAARAAARPGATGTQRHHIVFFGFLLALLCVLPLFVYPVFAMKVMCFALFASAFNLLLGFGGLLSFGHAAFFGSAGYVAAHAAKHWHLSLELSILLGVMVSALLGLLIGALSIRRQGIYFAMVTLAFAQMVYFFALQADFTGGEDGIQSVPRNPLFGVVSMVDNMSLYWVVLVVSFGGILFLYRITHSPFGQVLRAIRQNEARAISLGYSVDHYKLIVFVLSATFAGLAGAMKSQVFQLASLTDVHWAMSGEVVLMTLLGGMGTIFGPIAGAALIVTMQYFFAGFGAWVTVIQGAFFVAGVLLFREGIVGIIARWLRKPL